MLDNVRHDSDETTLTAEPTEARGSDVSDARILFSHTCYFRPVSATLSLLPAGEPMLSPRPQAAMTFSRCGHLARSPRIAGVADPRALSGHAFGACLRH